MCVHVHVHMRVRARVRVRVLGRVHVHMRERVCARTALYVCVHLNFCKTVLGARCVMERSTVLHIGNRGLGFLRLVPYLLLYTRR